MTETVSEDQWKEVIDLWIKKPNAFIKGVSSCKVDLPKRTLYPKSDKHQPITEEISFEPWGVTVESELIKYKLGFAHLAREIPGGLEKIFDLFFNFS